VDAERSAHDVLEEWLAVECRLQTGNYRDHTERASLRQRAQGLSALYGRLFRAERALEKGQDRPRKPTGGSL